MNNDNERAVAVRVLVEITSEKGYNNIVLKRTLDKSPWLTKSQKAFVTESVNGVLRNIIYIDYLINKVSSVSSDKMKPFILNDLRAAVYQLFFLSAPDYAVCSEAVELAKKNGYASLSGFVNGVLRNIIRKKDEIEPSDPKIKYSCPEWLFDCLKARFGVAVTEKILASALKPVRVTICANTLKAPPDELVRILEAEGTGIGIERTSLSNALSITGIDDMTRLRAFKDGLFHVMDVSSLLAVFAMKPERGASVLDMCAAPGGKSFASAYMMLDEGKITARDIYPRRLELLNESAKRLGVEIIETEERDALHFDTEGFGKFDFVIVDAPCSGLGLMRKKPDIKLTKTYEDVLKLAALQREILATAGKYVKPGGILLYCTCTLTKEENEDNADYFAENSGFDILDLTGFTKEFSIPAEAVIERGYVCLLPYHMDSDGFFISKFRKR